jgi:hypothetical protein
VEKQKVKVQAVIIPNDEGEPSVPVARVHDDIMTANLIFRQCGVEVESVGITIDPVLSEFSKMTGDVPTLERLFKHSALGVHTVYYVEKLLDPNDQKKLLNGATLVSGGVGKGMVLNAKISNSRTLAHELGHELGGLPDILSVVSLMYKAGHSQMADISATECSALMLP